MKQYICITGIAGFIGTHTFQELIKNDDVEIIGIDRYNVDFKHPKLLFYKCDIRDYKSLSSIFSQYNITSVLHLGAIVDLRAIENNPIDSYDTNVTGTYNMLLLAKFFYVKKFVFASSAAIFDSDNKTINPQNLYGNQKLLCEKMIEYFSQQYNIQCYILRYFNVYSFSPKYNGVISIIMDAVQNQKTFTVNGDGKQSRDFINVNDIAKINVHFLLSNSIKTLYTYSCGTGVSLTISKILQMLSLKYSIDISYQKSIKCELKYSIVLDNQISNILPFKILSLYEYFKNEV